MLADVRRQRREDEAKAIEERGGIQCRRCSLIKPCTEYTKSKAKVSGYHSFCKQCIAAIVASSRKQNPVKYNRARVQSYWSNPEKGRAKSKAYYATNPEAVLANGRKSRRVTCWEAGLVTSCKQTAKKRGFAFDLTTEYIKSLYEKQNGKCFWLGIPLVPSMIPRDPRRPSVDRYDSTIGYVQGNVVLACMFANMGRSCLTPEAVREFVAELRTYYKT